MFLTLQQVIETPDSAMNELYIFRTWHTSNGPQVKHGGKERGELRGHKHCASLGMICVDRKVRVAIIEFEQCCRASLVIVVGG